MRDPSADDFVHVKLEPLLSIVRSGGAISDDQVSRAFEAAGEIDAPRPSVESLLHAVCYRFDSVHAIAHSHPEATLGILSSHRASILATGAMFPDQVVVLGRNPLYIPYVDPGLDLARTANLLLDQHVELHREPPKIIYLQNHGIFALGGSIKEAMQITRMAEKCARVMLAAITAGDPRFLPEDEAERIDTRPDELLRRRQLVDPLNRPDFRSVLQARMEHHEQEVFARDA